MAGIKVVQCTNVSPTATLEQLRTLFSYLGKIEEIRIFPKEDTVLPVTSRVCFVKYEDESSVGTAQHLTNTVFIDRALIVVPCLEGVIPEEHKALQLAAPANALAGLGPAATGGGLLPTPAQPLLGQIAGLVPSAAGGMDPTYAALGLPQPPPLNNVDPSKIEEIRRTIYVGNLDSSQTVTAEQLLSFFQGIGEVKYVRMAGDETQPTRFAFVEFTEQASVAKALTYNGVMFAGRPLKINHSNNAIVKPPAKTAEAAQRELAETMKQVRDAQALIQAAIDPETKQSLVAANPDVMIKEPPLIIVAPKPDSKKEAIEQSVVATKSSSKKETKQSLVASKSGNKKETETSDKKKRSRSRSRSRKRSRSRSRSRRRSRSRSRSTRHRSRSRDRRRSYSRSRYRSRSRTPPRRRSRSPRRRSPKRRSRTRSPPPPPRRRRSRSRSKDRRSRSNKNSSKGRTNDSEEHLDRRRRSKTPPKSYRASRASGSRSRSPPPIRSRKRISRSRSLSKSKSHSRSRSRSGSPRRTKHKKDKKSRDRERSRERDRSSRKHKKDKDRDRKDRSSEDKDSKKSKSKVKRDYDEEEKGYDSDKEREGDGDKEGGMKIQVVMGEGNRPVDDNMDTNLQAMDMDVDTE